MQVSAVMPVRPNPSPGYKGQNPPQEKGTGMYVHTYGMVLGPYFHHNSVELRRVVAGIVIVEPGCFGLQNQVGGAGLGDTTNTPISIA